MLKSGAKRHWLRPRPWTLCTACVHRGTERNVLDVHGATVLTCRERALRAGHLKVRHSKAPEGTTCLSIEMSSR